MTGALCGSGRTPGKDNPQGSVPACPRQQLSGQIHDTHIPKAAFSMAPSCQEGLESDLLAYFTNSWLGHLENSNSDLGEITGVVC